MDKNHLATMGLARQRLKMERFLAPDEEQLIRWMLENGTPEAHSFLSRLEKATATAWRCPCGCASNNLSIDGSPEPSGRLHILADFIFGADGDSSLSGAFVSENKGVLAGLEVCELSKSCTSGTARKTGADVWPRLCFETDRAAVFAATRF